MTTENLLRQARGLLREGRFLADNGTPRQTEEWQLRVLEFLHDSGGVKWSEENG